jgi:AraC-like DNA-binding protein
VGEALEGPVAAFLRARDGTGAFVVAQPMNLALQTIARALAEPPLNPDSPAGRLWYESKILELLSLLLFAPTVGAESKREMFCDRQKRLSRERVEQACAILKRDLENPPSLEMLATQVGCGTFHLSRIFSQQVGQTVPQYLRQLRLERAAQLLREGKHNVTEAAIAVGYSSLSHFSKAFWETYGCCPGLYGNAKLREAAPAAGMRKRGLKG